ncbi:MAG: hypothetical protein K2O70_05730 [Desulfovibrionaceae bacterium]|nr:hypothetical protein [Desulfovibrionaceae bacterium]
MSSGEIKKSGIQTVAAQVVAGIAIAVLVGIGSAALTGWTMMVRIEGRLAVLERDVARHETAIKEDMKRMESVNVQNAQRIAEQERRLTHLETVLAQLRDDLAEVRADIKSLLRANAQH